MLCAVAGNNLGEGQAVHLRHYNMLRGSGPGSLWTSQLSLDTVTLRGGRGVTIRENWKEGETSSDTK